MRFYALLREQHVSQKFYHAPRKRNISLQEESNIFQHITKSVNPSKAEIRKLLPKHVLFVIIILFIWKALKSINICHFDK